MSFKVIIFHWKKPSEYNVMASRRSELHCLIQASIISSLITGPASILPSRTHSCFFLAGGRVMEIVRTLMFILNMRSVEKSQNRLWFKDWGIFLLSLLQMVKRKKKTKGRRNKIYCIFSDSEKSYNPKPQNVDIFLCSTVKSGPCQGDGCREHWWGSLDLELGVDFSRSVAVLKRLFSDLWKSDRGRPRKKRETTGPEEVSTQWHFISVYDLAHQLVLPYLVLSLHLWKQEVKG